MKKHISLKYTGAYGLGRKLLMVLVVLFSVAMGASAQEIIRVTGKVVTAEKGEPLYGVNIIDLEHIIKDRPAAQTDGDGRFVVSVHSNTSLRFQMVGAEPQVIKLKGRDSLVVRLAMIDTKLGDAEVVAKRIEKKVMIPEEPVVIKGNMAYFKNVIGVPSKIFGHDRRMVGQRVFKNLTRKNEQLMRPIAYDALEYNQTQDRMYLFDMNGKDGDPLAKYILVKNDTLKDKEGRNRDTFMYMDSIYVKHPKDNFRAITYIAIEDYNKIVYCDTIITSRGSIMPMRWLDFSFGASEITDGALFPKAIPQLRDSKGNIDLRFPIGKAEFDPNEAHNAAEISKLKEQIEGIAATKDATVQALKIQGTSSPDGRYASNLSLAQRRMAYAINYFRSQMPENLRNGMKFSSSASVAPWSEVVKLMRKDTLNAEADQVEATARRYKGDAVSQGMKRLPFYNSLLQGKYLPMLRAVGYTMNYSIFRNLTLDEIKELYAKDYRKLTNYEFFKLYRNEANDSIREKYLRQALEVSPSFMVAANDLSAMLIQRGNPDADILRRFAGPKAPAIVNQNQMVALLANDEYQAADSLADYVPVNEDTRLLHAVCASFMGRYKENYDIIASTGIRNEVVMLLAMKKNAEALEKSKLMTDDDAPTHYIKAICLNRSKDSNTAFKANKELRKALQLDPSLLEIADGDGDVNTLDVIKEMKNKSKEQQKK